MSKAVLSIEGVCKAFGAVIASDEITLDLYPGEIHALIGPNGAGKSTLIAQIAGNLKPDRGRIVLDGMDISSSGVADRANAGLARSFQVSSVAPNFTALQNTMLAVQGNSGKSFSFLRRAMNDNELVGPARDYLEQVGLAGREAVVASELSHGERRQLEVAMALALEPKVFLLDEPMAGLGAEGSKDMTALLAKIKHSAPILLIEHDMDAVFSLADKISVLVYGQIIATGSIDEIRNDPKVREAYLGSDET